VIKTFFRELFCWHDYLYDFNIEDKIYSSDIDPTVSVQCKKCGKHYWRYCIDPLVRHPLRNTIDGVREAKKLIKKDKK
jgi:hypothetical protein